MSGEIWSFIEIENGRLHDTACKMAAEARRTAGIFDGIPCGVLFSLNDCSPWGELQAYGLKRLYVLKGEGVYSPEVIAYALHRTIIKSNPHFVLLADTPLGAEVGGRLAHLLGKGLIGNCTDFERDQGKPVARRPVYEGKADALISWMTPPPHIATISLSALEDVKAKDNLQPEIITEEVPAVVTRTTLIKKWKVGLSELDLAEAEVVIGVGRGVNAEFMEVVNRLADLIGGVIGGTRIAVHSGLIPHTRLIGTTGKWLSSKAYIALGISGAPQHVMGIKEVRNIIAVNVARDAPIFRHAKTGIVGDLHEILQDLVALTEAAERTKT